MMKEQRQARLQQLLAQRKTLEEAAHKKRQIEAIHALFSQSTTIGIKNEVDSERIENEMTEHFPIASYGRIDWDKVHQKRFLKKADWIEIPTILQQAQLSYKSSVYLISGTYQYPVIEAPLDAILNRHEAIFDYGLEQWIYCPEAPFVIEIYEDVARIGWL